MSPWHDIVDWAGGYPFEFAKPEEIFNFYKNLGFLLEEMKTCAGGKGCNEFLFRRMAGQ
jgi:2-polyprenyl-6-hydroxyphenyl methylase/3-demethylubiquinone-9 3-methyltransferase